MDEEWLSSYYRPTVAKRGAAIIEARGASSAASAANAAIDHMYSWIHGTPEGEWVTRRCHVRRHALPASPPA